MLLLALFACPSTTDIAKAEDADGDGIAADRDCDDANPSVGLPEPGYVDPDGDGYGSGDLVTSCSAVSIGGDCDENNPGHNPGATETCDGVDQDCDGDIDESATAGPWYTDNDGDGYGGELVAASCDQPPGSVATSGDCDDADAAIHPDAADVPDGLDNDCDGAADNPPDDADADGWGVSGGDCDDGDTTVHPGADDPCEDGADQDCDGADPACSSTEMWTTADATFTLQGDSGGHVSDARPLVYDFDGDGVGDLALPADPPGVEGVAFFTGPLSGTLGFADLDGSLDSEFGNVVAAPGDADLDGFADLYVGTEDYHGDCFDVCLHEGAVNVYRGPVLDGLGWDDQLGYVHGTSSDEYVGAAVSAPGDLNGDAHPDLLAGAPGLSQVLLWSKVHDGSWAYTTASASVTGGQELGSALAGPGDTDADGVNDLLIGARGAAHIVYGPLDGDLPADAADATVTSSDILAGDAVEWHDVDGDGYDDALVGATGASSAWIFAGPVAGALASGDARQTVTGEGLGTEVSADDLDGDGLVDLVLGASAYDGGQGAVHILPGGSGSTTTDDASITITGAGQFGQRVTLGDLTGDGLPDVLATEPATDRVYGFSFAP